MPSPFDPLPRTWFGRTISGLRFAAWFLRFNAKERKPATQLDAERSDAILDMLVIARKLSAVAGLSLNGEIIVRLDDGPAIEYTIIRMFRRYPWDRSHVDQLAIPYAAFAAAELTLDGGICLGDLGLLHEYLNGLTDL